jgi:antitoxin HicB
MGKQIDYPFEVRPLSVEEGGGFLISYPDFSDCISDGETVEEALTNGQDALKSTIAALKAKELPVPPPNGGGVASGRFVARVPKTVHARLLTFY